MVVRAERDQEIVINVLKHSMAQGVLPFKYE
jgi:hypothetical protein